MLGLNFATSTRKATPIARMATTPAMMNNVSVFFIALFVNARIGYRALVVFSPFYKVWFDINSTSESNIPSFPFPT